MLAEGISSAKGQLTLAEPVESSVLQVTPARPPLQLQDPEQHRGNEFHEDWQRGAQREKNAGARLWFGNSTLAVPCD